MSRAGQMTRDAFGLPARPRTVTRDVLHSTYFGTDRYDPDDPARTFAERRGRCYELVCAALLWGTTPTGTLAVHGSIDGHTGFGRIGHAWLWLPNGHAWEPITGDVYRTREAWLEFADARVEHVYDEATARRLVLATERMGPWEPTLYR